MITFSDAFHKTLIARRGGYSITALQTEGNKLPLFIIPGVLFYEKLGAYLTKDQPVFCFEYFEHKDVKSVACQYIKEMKIIQPNGPYRIGGYCRFAVIAFEMAQQLRMMKEEVSSLIFIELHAPNVRISKSSKDYLIKELRSYYKDIHQLSIHQKIVFVAQKFYRLLLLIRGKIKRRYYTFEQYNGNVTIFKASNQNNIYYKDDPQLGWSKYIRGRIDTFEIAGDHGSIFKEPGIVELATKLSAVLNT